MEWYDSTLPMRPSYGLTSEDFDAMEDQYFIQLEDEIFGEDWLDCYATEILDARYEKVNVDDVVKHLDHLNDSQKSDLLAVLKETPNYLMARLACIRTRNFTSMWIPMQNQYTRVRTRYRAFIYAHLRRSWTIWSTLRC